MSEEFNNERPGQENSSIEKSAEKKKTIPVIVVAAVIAIILIVVIVIVVFGNKDFKDMYSKWVSKTWCTIASDGSYMIIDSNPENRDDNPKLTVQNITDTMGAIREINQDLGFSDDVAEKIFATTWRQGRQVETNENYRVTWTYHPDNGLEVLYEIIDH